MGIPASEILRFYREKGPSIFGQPENWVRRCLRLARWPFRPKYDATSLRTELTQIFGDRKLGESETRLVIPAYHPDEQGIYVFKTAHHSRLEIDYRVTTIDVALATAAAPVFFPAHRLPSGSHLVDGGQEMR